MCSAPAPLQEDVGKGLQKLICRAHASAISEKCARSFGLGSQREIGRNGRVTEVNRLRSTRAESSFSSGSATTLEAKALIHWHRDVVLRVVEGKDNFDPVQPGVAHKTNCAFRHPEVERILGVFGPIRNSLIINPRMGISQKCFHIQTLLN